LDKLIVFCSTYPSDILKYIQLIETGVTTDELSNTYIHSIVIIEEMQCSIYTIVRLR